MSQRFHIFSYSDLILIPHKEFFYFKVNMTGRRGCEKMELYLKRIMQNKKKNNISCYDTLHLPQNIFKYTSVLSLLS